MVFFIKLLLSQHTSFGFDSPPHSAGLGVGKVREWLCGSQLPAGLKPRQLTSKIFAIIGLANFLKNIKTFAQAALFSDEYFSTGNHSFSVAYISRLLLDMFYGLDLGFFLILQSRALGS